MKEPAKESEFHDRELRELVEAIRDEPVPERLTKLALQLQALLKERSRNCS
jgi:hypothetical protein